MDEKKQEATDSASALVEQILGNEEKLKMLVMGADTDRAAIAVSAIISTGDDVAVQKAFLTSLIRLLGIEGKANETDRRDAAVELLKCAPVMDIFSRHSGALFDAYLEAVSNQTKENDPFVGSINSLLEVGIALAPYFPVNDLSRTQLTHLWNQRAKDFTHTDGREHIEEQAKHIAERMTKLGSRDARVYDLRARGYKNREIAETLHINEGSVEQSVGRLIDLGILSMRRGTKPLIDPEVEKLRNLGYTVVQIANALNESQHTISSSIQRLLAKSEIDHVYPGHREDINALDDVEHADVLDSTMKGQDDTAQTFGTPSPVAQSHLSRRKQWVDTKVQPLKAEGLSNKRISALLGIPVREIADSELRLLEQKRIEKIPRRTRKEMEALDDAVALLKDEGLTLEHIAEKLTKNPSTIIHSIGRLQEQERIERVLIRRNPEELADFDKRIATLKKQGLKRKEIANTLGVDEGAVKEAIERNNKREKKL